MKNGSSKKYKIYLDTNLLVGWLKDAFRKKRKELGIIEFLEDNPEIESFISMLSIAEIVHVLKFDSYFKSHELLSEDIKALFNNLQNTVGFEIIRSDEKEKGIFITSEIIEYSEICKDLTDCIHVNLAKSNDLIFVTNDPEICKLKKFYEKIMTFNELTKQFKKN